MLRTTVKSLMKPDAYPEEVSSVELIQTHVSYIFLTDQHAYKIKKPVDFGFLNFSTIDRRRFYCNEEVRLTGVSAPTSTKALLNCARHRRGGISWNGAILDYAVKMKRLPADRMLDRLVVAGRHAATMRRFPGLSPSFTSRP